MVRGVTTLLLPAENEGPARFTVAMGVAMDAADEGG